MRKLNQYASLGSLKHLLSHPALWLRLPEFLWRLRTYRRLERRRAGQQARLRFYPCLEDAQLPQGPGGYFYQDCWAARQVFREQPAYVVDVGSTVLLVGILSQFRPCVSVDIRPLDARLEGLRCLPGSVLALPFNNDEVPCLTTMCVLEHIGLGRYGDPLNPSGTQDAVREIARVIAPGGVAVYSVPVGPEELLEFNAHRRFRYPQAAEFFPGWDLVDSCVLSPIPIPYGGDGMLATIRDPTACFCVRKPKPNAAAGGWPRREGRSR